MEDQWTRVEVLVELSWRRWRCLWLHLGACRCDARPVGRRRDAGGGGGGGGGASGVASGEHHLMGHQANAFGNSFELGRQIADRFTEKINKK